MLCHLKILQVQELTLLQKNTDSTLNCSVTSSGVTFGIITDKSLPNSVYKIIMSQGYETEILTFFKASTTTLKFFALAGSVTKTLNSNDMLHDNAK